MQDEPASAGLFLHLLIVPEDGGNMFRETSDNNVVDYCIPYLFPRKHVVYRPLWNNGFVFNYVITCLLCRNLTTASFYSYHVTYDVKAHHIQHIRNL
jgi:hypothetical protein